MKTIKESTKDLIASIVESEEYIRFVQIRNEVSKDPELRKKINQFRKHVYEVQNSRQPLDMYDEQEKLVKEYEEFRKNTLVSDFLQAELRVCRIMQKVTADIADSIDLDIAEVTKGLEV